MDNRSWLLILSVTIFLVACGQNTPDASDAVPKAATAVMTTEKALTATADSPTAVPKDVSGTILGTATPAPRIGGGGGGACRLDRRASSRSRSYTLKRSMSYGSR